MDYQSYSEAHEGIIMTGGRFRAIGAAIISGELIIMHIKTPVTLLAAVLLVLAAATTGSLHSYRESPEGLIIIDIRGAGEIQSAIGGDDCRPYHLEWPEQFMNEIERIPKDARIILYCLSGGRSARAAAYLRAGGYDNVHDAGGILSWKGPVIAPHDMKHASSLPQASCEEPDDYWRGFFHQQ
jgi:rhodanese-related sulfurtransferase